MAEISQEYKYITDGYTQTIYETPDKKSRAVVYWKSYDSLSTGRSRYHALGFLGKSKKPSWGH